MATWQAVVVISPHGIPCHRCGARALFVVADEEADDQEMAAQQDWDDDDFTAWCQKCWDDSTAGDGEQMV